MEFWKPNSLPLIVSSLRAESLVWARDSAFFIALLQTQLFIYIGIYAVHDALEHCLPPLWHFSYYSYTIDRVSGMCSFWGVLGLSANALYIASVLSYIYCSYTFMASRIAARANAFWGVLRVAVHMVLGDRNGTFALYISE